MGPVSSLKISMDLDINLLFMEESSSSDTNAIISLARKHVPNIVVIFNLATDLSLQLSIDNV
jgi:hypothetical protein